MKKIAKGIVLFLITVMVLLMPATLLTCYAEEGTTESISEVPEDTETSESEIVITNSIGRKSINATAEGYIVTVENQSAKKVKGVKLTVNVGGDKVTIRKRSNLDGFDSYNVNLADYFSEEYMEGKTIKVNIDNCFSGWEIFWLVIVILFVLSLCDF